MPRTAPIRIADQPEIKAAIRYGIRRAMEAERRHILALVRASCACPSCKDHIAALITETAGEAPREATTEGET